MSPEPKPLTKEFGIEAGKLQPIRNPVWKRFFDLALLLLVLPIAALLGLVIAAWIKLTSKGPIFFRQERVGLGESKFAFYKFRSMRVDVDTGVHQFHLKELVRSNIPMEKLDALGDPRLVPGGRLLRASGLDELPQLFNVLRGEMSVVGPRPCITSELSLYREDQRKRFLVMPGLTGYWQVRGKNATTFTEMLELDEYYVDHRSPLLDLGILIRTPLVLGAQVIEMLGTKKQTSGTQETEGQKTWGSLAAPETKR